MYSQMKALHRELIVFLPVNIQMSKRERENLVVVVIVAAYPTDTSTRLTCIVALIE